MKKLMLFVLLFAAMRNSSSLLAQDLKVKDVPAIVNEAVMKKYTDAKKVGKRRILKRTGVANPERIILPYFR